MVRVEALSRRGTAAARCLPALFVSLLAAQLGAAVHYVPVPRYVQFAEATEPGALRYACASTDSELAQHFASLGAPFNEKLVRRIKRQGVCHIFYEPTLPGFRALPDNRKVTGLIGFLDPVSFVVGRRASGDSLDIIRTVLQSISRPIDVVLSVSGPFGQETWAGPKERHFGGLPHAVRLRTSGHNDTHPWSQDHLKAGEIAGQPQFLVPRRLFEGREEDGELYKPLLAAVSDPLYTRSKLSWEGGDIQFISAPRDPAKLVMVHGGTSRDYWGKALTPAEHSYVLKREFGADLVVDATHPGVHADFAVAFLPGEDTAFVSSPIQHSIMAFQAAAKALRELYGPDAPVRLSKIARYDPRLADDAVADLANIHSELTSLRREIAAVPEYNDKTIEVALDVYAAEHCPTKWEECFLPEGKKHMQQVDPELLRRAADYAELQEQRDRVGQQLLGLLEGQLPDSPSWGGDALDAIAANLGRLGFKIIRLPVLVAPSIVDRWPGVGYTNMLVVDHTLFVPTVGLGEYETKLINDMQRRLPAGYSVVPVPARGALSMNGGVHCVFGIAREVAVSTTAAPPAAWTEAPTR